MEVKGMELFAVLDMVLVGIYACISEI